MFLDFVFARRKNKNKDVGFISLKMFERSRRTNYQDVKNLQRRAYLFFFICYPFPLSDDFFPPIQTLFAACILLHVFYLFFFRILFGFRFKVSVSRI